MKIERFVPEKHLELLKICLLKRQKPTTLADNLPSLGFVASTAAYPVSFGFLRMVEGKYAIVDGLVSNSDCVSEARHEGNDLVIKACIEAAKSLNIKNLIAWTLDDSTLERSIRNGFVELPHAFLAYNFNRKA